MLGLIIKDVLQNIRIKKYKSSFIFNYFCALIIIFASKQTFGLVLPLFGYIPFLITPMLLQQSIERDAISDYNRTLLAMPITRNEVIKSRYILGVAFSLVNVLIMIPGVMVHIYLYETITLVVGLQMLLGSLIMCLFSLAINYFSFLVLGGKGAFVYIGMIFLVIFIYLKPDLLKLDVLFTSLMSMKIEIVLIFGFVISVILLLCSYWVSSVIYSKRQFS